MISVISDRLQKRSQAIEKSSAFTMRDRLMETNL